MGLHLNALVERYVSVWNEADPKARRAIITELWTEDGVHAVQPPQEVAKVAADIGLTAVLRSRGHAELENRVTRAFEEFVAPGTYTFRPRDNAARVDDVVKFGWEMLAVDGDEVAAVGLEILVLDPRGRIRADYQFIEA